jgi:hypothetical protein
MFSFQQIKDFANEGEHKISTEVQNFITYLETNFAPADPHAQINAAIHILEGAGYTVTAPVPGAAE